MHIHTLHARADRCFTILKKRALARTIMYWKYFLFAMRTAIGSISGSMLRTHATCAELRLGCMLINTCKAYVHVSCTTQDENNIPICTHTYTHWTSHLHTNVYTHTDLDICAQNDPSRLLDIARWPLCVCVCVYICWYVCMCMMFTEPVFWCVCLHMCVCMNIHTQTHAYSMHTREQHVTLTACQTQSCTNMHACLHAYTHA